MSKDKTLTKEKSTRKEKSASKEKSVSKEKSLIKFSYKAFDDAGKKVSGTEMATSAGAAHVALLARGLQPTEVEAKQGLMKFEITKKKVPRQDVMNFTRQLAVFMRAGIPIMEALEVIVEETQNKMLKAILSEMVDSLRAGRSPQRSFIHPSWRQCLS